MILNVTEERLLVTSDMHVGSFFSEARLPFVDFLNYACAHRCNVVINGDGIDVVLTSVERLSSEAMGLMREVRRAAEQITIYYTVGNHDLILEHGLGDWGGLRLVPFLNVQSGPRRIRIEHGHLYDPILIDHPRLKHGLTRFAGHLCRLYPPWYHWQEGWKAFRYKHLRRLTGRESSGGPEVAQLDNPVYLNAANEIASRGFDAVVFGHTHHQAVLSLDRGRSAYYNTGSWFRHPYYLVIDRGEMALEAWTGVPTHPPAVPVPA